jgi:hypothetical protein
MSGDGKLRFFRPRTGHLDIRHRSDARARTVRLDGRGTALGRH